MLIRRSVPAMGAALAVRTVLNVITVDARRRYEAPVGAVVAEPPVRKERGHD